MVDVKNLEEIGLSNKESEVYLALLKKGSFGGGELAKFLNVDRTHVYNILRNLINKGLVSHIIKDKKTFFQACSPKNLLNSVYEKEQAIKAIIPELLLLEKNPLKHFSVKVLEGKSGLRTLSRLFLDSKPKEVLVYGGTGKSYQVLEYEMPHVAKETKVMKMKGRIITGKELKEESFTKLSNFKVRYVDELTPSSTMIFGDKVSINVFDEKPFFILIESKSVADSYKKYFESLWKQAKV